ncbi:hypothetical protein A2U01_0047648, partial [Trifolium medium]|nr:hypothetical protein [Trifolium medium]
KERDAAKKKVTELEQQLREMMAAFDDYKNKHALQQDLMKDLEKAEAKLAEVVKEKDVLVGQVKGLNEKVAELEEKMKSAEVTLIAEEERGADPAGLYEDFSQADLVKTVLDWQGSIVEVSSSQFRNAIVQIQLLNPNVEINLDDLDEEKEVRDGRIATPLEGDN